MYECNPKTKHAARQSSARQRQTGLERKEEGKMTALAIEQGKPLFYLFALSEQEHQRLRFLALRP